MFLTILQFVRESKHTRKIPRLSILFLTFSVSVSSDWPTIPQLFVNGEFVGGCDIMTSMYQEGELTKMLKDLKLIDPNQIN